jgi:predicted dehydrogenase
MLISEKPDFVDIITPPETHTDFCEIAIKQGVAIICQKPLAPTYKESMALAKAIKNSHVRMMVHENFRFQPWHREIKKLLNQNIIGHKLHTINLRMRMGDGWQEDAYMNRQPYFREMPQLLIYETGVHFIDVFRYLIGDISKVYSKLKTLNSNIKGEDFAWVNFEFKNGVLGFLDANRFNENTADDPRLTFGSIWIEGNKGTIRLFDDGTITIQLLGEKETKHDYPFEKINFAGDCVYNTQKHFIDCLRSGAPFETDVQAYLDNIIVQEAIYESNETGLPIKIN